MPFSLCESGPPHIDGVGNYVLDILAPASSDRVLSTLYFLDSHGQISSKIRDPDYEPVMPSQIDWFTSSCQARQDMLERDHTERHHNLSLVFQHIPLPEFEDSRLNIRNGHRREPSEGPSLNTNLYDALKQEGISALSCGHDHVNDFCALLPRSASCHHRPWLVCAGTVGFGAYCSYGRRRFHRRARVYQMNPSIGRLETWKRVEYAKARIDELVLVEDGAVADDTS